MARKMCPTPPLLNLMDQIMKLALFQIFEEENIITILIIVIVTSTMMMMIIIIHLIECDSTPRQTGIHFQITFREITLDQLFFP